MKKILIVGFIVITVSLLGGGPQLVGTFGLAHHAAVKVIDAIFIGSSWATILLLIGTGGGIAALGMAAFKTIVKRLGRKLAVAW